MTLHSWRITPAQHPSPPVPQLSVSDALTRLHYHQGEKRLMLAVLIDAISSIEHCSSGRGAKNWGDCQSAVQWVRAHDRQWLFSFENICAVLELDVDRLRTALQVEFPSLFFTASRVDTCHPKASVNLPPVRG
jgi:hypothetical protein